MALISWESIDGDRESPGNKVIANASGEEALKTT